MRDLPHLDGAGDAKHKRTFHLDRAPLRVAARRKNMDSTACLAWLELEALMAKKTTRLEKAMGKTEILTELAASAEVSKKEVGRVFDALAALIERHISKRSVGTFVLPGLLRVKVVQTPARPARKDVPNPFRPGETMNVAAKPARRKVKVLPLGKLK